MANHIAGPSYISFESALRYWGLIPEFVQTTAWLVEDMRMDEEILATLNTDRINDWLPDSPKKESLHYLLKALDSLK